jgi:hypothetical protein
MLVLGNLKETNEILVCRISSVEKRHNSGNAANYTIKDFKKAGLNFESTVMTDKMTIIPESDIKHGLGTMPSDELQGVMSLALIQRTLSDMGRTAQAAPKPPSHTKHISKNRTTPVSAPQNNINPSRQQASVTPGYD